MRNDFLRRIKIIKSSGYLGYIPIETLKLVGRPKPLDPFVPVPQMMKELILPDKRFRVTIGAENYRKIKHTALGFS